MHRHTGAVCLVVLLVVVDGDDGGDHETDRRRLSQVTPVLGHGGILLSPSSSRHASDFSCRRGRARRSGETARKAPGPPRCARPAPPAAPSGPTSSPKSAMTPSPVYWLATPPERWMAPPTASKYRLRKNTTSYGSRCSASRVKRRRSAKRTTTSCSRPLCESPGGRPSAAVAVAGRSGVTERSEVGRS